MDVSAPYTQYGDPVEKEKTWLHRHGLASEHIDSLLSTCNHRSVGVCDDLVILQMLRNVVTKQPVVHNGTLVNLDHLRMELEISVEQKTAELRKAARHAEFGRCGCAANGKEHPISSISPLQHTRGSRHVHRRSSSLDGGSIIRGPDLLSGGQGQNNHTPGHDDHKG